MANIVERVGPKTYAQCMSGELENEVGTMVHEQCLVSVSSNVASPMMTQRICTCASAYTGMKENAPQRCDLNRALVCVEGTTVIEHAVTRSLCLTDFINTVPSQTIFSSLKCVSINPNLCVYGSCA